MEKPKNEQLATKPVPTVSAVLDDGRIVEMVYDPRAKQSAFAVWNGEACTIEPRVVAEGGAVLVPYSPRNNLIKNEIVLLPSAPEAYGSEKELLSAIQSFIHRYVDVSPLFEQVATYYVLLTWVYDGFNELPYLRLRGDPGSGKTRFLLTIGSLCYKPIFASGASTISPIFRMLDSFRGTLIIDEGDFRMSDEKAELVKILNNGNAKGFPVLRSEVNAQKEFNPQAFNVYGPKLVATRGFFEDRALESRFITEETGQAELRRDIPINLPPEYKDEALRLRNKLLLFRFQNVNKRTPTEALVDRTIEPRLNQVFVPLLAIIEDEEARAAIKELARRYNAEMTIERGMDMEAQILEVIRSLLESPYEARLSIKEITSLFIDRYGPDYERRITPKWIGFVIRKKLKLNTHKSEGVYVISRSEDPKLRQLFKRYNVETDEQAIEEAGEPDQVAVIDEALWPPA